MKKMLDFILKVCLRKHPGVNLINVLRARFLYERRFGSCTMYMQLEKKLPK